MKFRSYAHNYRFIIKPEDLVRDQYGRVIQSLEGFVVQFRGGMLDTNEAQLRNNWTDEQRLGMERAIMSNHAFRDLRVFDGGGTEDRPIGNVGMMEIDLAPGQLLPKEHEEFCSTLPKFAHAQAAPAANAKKCIAKIETPDGTISCPRDAEEGTVWCPVHAPEPAMVS